MISHQNQGLLTLAAVAIISGHQFPFGALGRAERSGRDFRQFVNRQEVVNRNSASLQTKTGKRLLARFPSRCILAK
jgi:hypothetical protein